MSLRSRKNQDSDSKGDSLIQMMTISLFIILLAFFILLNSIARVDEKKIRKVVSSIVENFGGTMPIKAGGEQPEEVFSSGVSPLDMQTLSSSNVPGLSDIKLKVDRKQTTLSIPEDVLFVRFGTQINPKGEDVINALADIIKANPVPVLISGHTDNVPLVSRGGERNLELTVLRSMRVMEFLVTRANIPPQQLTAVGWGKEKPTAPNKTLRSRMLNNRIDVSFSHEASLNKPKGFFIFKDFFFNVKNKD